MSDPRRQPAGTRITLEPTTTRARFRAGSLLGAVPGTLPVIRAEIDVDDAGRPTAVRAELDHAGVDTGRRRRDKDLRSARFLDTEQNPVLQFESTSVSTVSGPGPTDRWQITGRLLTGTNQAAVGFTVERTGPDTFIGTGRLDRRDLGITAAARMIRPEVGFEITANVPGR
jgi:polyisoprenoid-binding protein YceI